MSDLWAFAESRAQPLTGHCLGPPSVTHGGGRRAQLLKLRASDHPVSGAKLPQPTMMDGTPVSGIGTYSNLEGGASQVPEGFVKYDPGMGEQLTANTSGTSAAEKRALMVAKVKLREACAKRRRRKRDAEEEAEDLYADFLGETVTHAGYNEVATDACEADDNDSRVFWEKLGAESVADSVFRHCAKEPTRFAQPGSKRSRLNRLME